MCGRFTLTDPDPRIQRMRFELRESVRIEAEPRYNVAPTDPVLAIRLDRNGAREAGLLRWGLIPDYADPDSFDRLLINARAETVTEAAAFRGAFAGYRCLIVADGFYEWRPAEAGKQPVWVTRPEREPFAFAGLWARAKPQDGESLHSCTIITCAPSETMAPIHDRMPVILQPGDEARWLDPQTNPDDLHAVLRPTNDLLVTEVNDAVNNVRNDGPQLLEPPLNLFQEWRVLPGR